MKTVLESYLDQLEEHRQKRNILKLSKASRLNRATISRMVKNHDGEIRRLLMGLIDLEKAGFLDPMKRYGIKQPAGLMTGDDLLKRLKKG